LESKSEERRCEGIPCKSLNLNPYLPHI
jgi:WD repeat-containing protein 90